MILDMYIHSLTYLLSMYSSVPQRHRCLCDLPFTRLLGRGTMDFPGDR